MKRTDLFAPLERLIEEQGSSTIQGKHIAFLREQLSVLKEEAARLEARNKEFEAENSDLRQQIDKFKRPSTTPRWGSQPRIKGRMEQ